MKQYREYLKYVLSNGIKKEDRTGTGTLSVFGYQMRFDLSKGFPIVTTKKLHFRGVAVELLWFLSGSTNTKFLEDNGVTIWREWQSEDGDIGPGYGKQWRAWETTSGETIDQISNLIRDIKVNPDSRRLIVSAWNVGDLDRMVLPPCHAFFQFYVKPLDVFGRINSLPVSTWDTLFKENSLSVWSDRASEDYKSAWVSAAEKVLDDYGIRRASLSCMLTQRSADSFLGVPYNIASYALLTHMIAHQCDLEVGELIWSGGDCHIYSNHLEQVSLQLTRKPYNLPKLVFKRKPDSIFDYTYEDFELVNYQAHPRIKGDVSI